MTRILELMKKFFCLLALSACFFAYQKQQASDKVRAQIPSEVRSTAEGPAEIGNTPTPGELATTPNPVASVTPHSETSVTPTPKETPILSPTPTPAISSTPESTVQTPEAGKKPVATSTPRLRLNPLSTGTPFPQASASAESNSPASSVAPTVPAETGSQAQTIARPDASTSATASWIRSASGKKRARASVSPSPSP
jgi:hypothetical protein